MVTLRKREYVGGPVLVTILPIQFMDRVATVEPVDDVTPSRQVRYAYHFDSEHREALSRWSIRVCPTTVIRPLVGPTIGKRITALRNSRTVFQTRRVVVGEHNHLAAAPLPNHDGVFRLVETGSS